MGLRLTDDKLLGIGPVAIRHEQGIAVAGEIGDARTVRRPVDVHGELTQKWTRANRRSEAVGATASPLCSARLPRAISRSHRQ